MDDQSIDEVCEKAYWQFDARRKGYNEWKGCPMSERDAFKAEARMLAKGYFPTRRVMLQIVDAFMSGMRIRRP